MSLFAVMQTIPFHDQWPVESEAVEAAGAVAVASMIICCVGCSVVGILLRRRLRVPQKGQAHVLSGRRTKTFDFTRTLTSKSNATKGKKVLVKWHLKFDSVVKEIDTYEGLRHVSVDLDAGRERQRLSR